MATRSDFEPDEWATLSFATIDTLMYLSIVQPGFFDMLREAGQTGQFLAQEAAAATSTLVRDLAFDARQTHERDKALNPANVETPTLERLTAASELVERKAPDELSAFRIFILGIAETVAEAAGGVSPAEMHAIEKVRAALG